MLPRAHTTPLNRALSKLGLLSRKLATDAIRAGRVRVDGRIVTDPFHPVVPERARISIDETMQRRPAWRTLMKAHIGVDAKSGLVHSVGVTTGSVHACC